MTDEKKEEGNENDNGNKSMTIEQLQETLKNNQNEQNDTIRNVVKETIAATIPKQEEPVKASVDLSGEVFSEFKDELESLGIEDEKQAKALLSLISKITGKSVSNVKKEVLGDLDGKFSYKEKRDTYNTVVISRYPDALNPASKLCKKSQELYNEMDEKVRKEDPKAAGNAIKLAAQELGIQALTKEQILASNSVNNINSGGSGTAKDSDKVTDKQKNFAKSFGVNPEKFAEKLKEIQAKANKGLVK